MATKTPLFWLVLVAQALICFLLWRSSPYDHITTAMKVLWVVVALAAALILRMFSVEAKGAIVGGVVIAGVLANIANILLDWRQDATSHNLFPFELALTAVVNFGAAAIGLRLGMALRPKSSATR
jgi:hypothetical protein